MTAGPGPAGALAELLARVRGVPGLVVDGPSTTLYGGGWLTDHMGQPARETANAA